MDWPPNKPRSLGANAPWVALLGIAALINFIDRSNLSIAAPLLKNELRLDAWQLGVLLSAFFWTYTALQFVMGWIIDRFEVNVVIAVGFLVWSLATAATGLAQGFAILLLMRLLLGVGESVVFPSFSKIIACRVPEEARGFANGVIIAGIHSGPAVGMFAAGVLMAKYGWRPVFLGAGLLGLAWLPAWRKWMPRGQSLTAPAALGIATIAAILRQRSFWGACTGHFCVNYMFYVMLTWLPFYLVHDRHLAIATMSKIAGAYFLIDASSALATGWLSDHFIRRGHSPTVVRKAAMAIGHTTTAVGLAFCAVSGPHTYLVWLMAAGVGCGMSSSGVYAFSQTLAGSQVAGTWTGFQNGFANFAGVIAPALTGFLVNRSGNFLAPLMITAAVSLTGTLAWVLMIQRLEPVIWTPSPLALPAARLSS